MEREPVLVGQCFCGKVRYEAYAAPSDMTSCYYQTYRSIHGAPFAPFARVMRDDFQFTESEGLDDMRLTNIATRTVCQFCHSAMTMVYDAAPEEIGIVGGTIDESSSTAAVPEVQDHIFVGEKPQWYRILDDARQSIAWRV